MKYELTTHDGRSLALDNTDDDAISRLAKKAELISVRVNGQVEYLSKGAVRSIKPIGVLPGESLPRPEPEIVVDKDGRKTVKIN